MPRVLIIDDNPDILVANQKYLSAEGFVVTLAETGAEAVSQLVRGQFDCIVMDVMLPDMDGFTLCDVVRSTTSTPIIFLTCLDTLEDKLRGLMVGGDDYMTKPYNLQELSARIHAILRREGINRKMVSPNGVTIDKENRIVCLAEKNVFLSQKEFELFLLLFENPGTVFTREQLHKMLWPNGTDIGAVAVYILKLRRKLSFAEKYIGKIVSEYSQGYSVVRAGSDGGLLV